SGGRLHTGLLDHAPRGLLGRHAGGHVLVPEIRRASPGVGQGHGGLLWPRGHRLLDQRNGLVGGVVAVGAGGTSTGTAPSSIPAACRIASRVARSVWSFRRITSGLSPGRGMNCRL